MNINTLKSRFENVRSGLVAAITAAIRDKGDTHNGESQYDFDRAGTTPVVSDICEGSQLIISLGHVSKDGYLTFFAKRAVEEPVGDSLDFC